MIQKFGLYAIWVIAMLSSSVTIYLIEAQHWTPCHLCWYQLLCMLPLVVIAGKAAWHGFLGIAPYIMPQCIVGLLLALYQIVLQFYCPFPTQCRLIEICNPVCNSGSTEGCTEKIALQFNINLAYLSGFAFLFIVVLLFIILRISKKGDSHENH